MKKSEMTPEQRAKYIEERDAKLDERRRREEERFNDPDYVKRREWVKAICGDDADRIAHFAVILMENAGVLHKENEDLVEKLNYIHSMAFGLSSEKSKALPHQKYNIARISLEHDPEDPIARAFLAAFKTSRTLSAKANANKGHARTNKAKEFVRSEWLEHSAAYVQNKSAFARDYVRRVFNEFEVTITEKQMREVWLKDTPPASKPDGLPANG
ncbi:hypothetical protein [Diaphorobacter sp.]|uniref:hypothetical protein n=1 Tax=Diaphorobacter sp. TaxID=1934310 RepID=UPI0025891D25|nr:hypothetical protein [Diaphorobacter sp.]